jgi:hypothetical protein
MSMLLATRVQCDSSHFPLTGATSLMVSSGVPAEPPLDTSCLHAALHVHMCQIGARRTESSRLCTVKNCRPQQQIRLL